MRRFVYMIDYEDVLLVVDQIECHDINDLLTQLRYLKDDGVTVINVKLVEREDRYHEEDISYSLYNKVIALLGYKPSYMCCRGKNKKVEWDN